MGGQGGSHTLQLGVFLVSRWNSRRNGWQTNLQRIPMCRFCCSGWSTLVNPFRKPKLRSLGLNDVSQWKVKNEGICPQIAHARWLGKERTHIAREPAVSVARFVSQKTIQQDALNAPRIQGGRYGQGLELRIRNKWFNVQVIPCPCIVGNQRNPLKHKWKMAGYIL